MHPYTHSERKIDILNNSIEMFNNLISACEEIKAGNSEVSVLKKHNINARTFRNLTMNEKLGFEFPESCKFPEDTDDVFMINDDFKFLSTEEKIFCAVGAVKKITDIPPGLEESVPFVLDDDAITDREKKVLLYRYGNDMTFEEIGEILNVGKERVRQILAKVLRKLRRPNRYRVLKYGVKYAELKSELEKTINEGVTSNYDGLIKSINDAKKENDIVKLKKLKADIEASLLKLGEGKVENVYISLKDLRPHLSVRTYNCLSRANLTTVSSIQLKSTDELLKIRNMGVMCVNELKSKFKELGIDAMFLND